MVQTVLAKRRKIKKGVKVGQVYLHEGKPFFNTTAGPAWHADVETSRPISERRRLGYRGVSFVPNEGVWAASILSRGYV